MFNELPKQTIRQIRANEELKLASKDKARVIDIVVKHSEELIEEIKQVHGEKYAQS